MRTYQRVIPATLLPLMLFPGWMPRPPLAVVLPFVVGYPIWARRVRSAWSPSADRIAMGQSAANSARHSNRIFVWFMLICSLGFVAVGFLEIVKLLFARNTTSAQGSTMPARERAVSLRFDARFP